MCQWTKFVRRQEHHSKYQTLLHQCNNNRRICMHAYIHTYILVQLLVWTLISSYRIAQKVFLNSPHWMEYLFLRNETIMRVNNSDCYKIDERCYPMSLWGAVLSISVSVLPSVFVFEPTMSSAVSSKIESSSTTLLAWPKNMEVVVWDTYKYIGTSTSMYVWYIHAWYHQICNKHKYIIWQLTIKVIYFTNTFCFQ